MIKYLKAKQGTGKSGKSYSKISVTFLPKAPKKKDSRYTWEVLEVQEITGITDGPLKKGLRFSKSSKFITDVLP